MLENIVDILQKKNELIILLLIVLTALALIVILLVIKKYLGFIFSDKYLRITSRILILLALVIMFGWLIEILLGLDKVIDKLEQFSRIITWQIILLIGFFLLKDYVKGIIDHLKSRGGRFWGIHFPQPQPPQETSSKEFVE